MIEQINIGSWAKRVRNFSLWVIEACRRRLASEKRAYTSIKVMKNEHPAFFPSEQDDIVNSLLQRRTVIELQFPLSWQWQTACWLCHRQIVWMISSYGDQINHQGIILHIIIVLHQRCLNCSRCFQRHLMFYTCNYNIRVTHKWCY